MVQIVVIVIRVLLGLALGVVGLITFGQGLVMVAHANFPTGKLILAMTVGMAAGSALLLTAWRLLSTTLRMHPQSTQ